MISVIPKNSTITSIDCGSPTGDASQRFSGAIDISQFSNLNNFYCTGNDIQSFSGNQSCPNLKVLVLSDNLLSGFPLLNSNPLLEELRLDQNKLAGNCPSFQGFPNLKTLRLNENIGISGQLPPLTGDLSNVTSMYTIKCTLTGGIVLNNKIIDYRCDSQEGVRGSKKITGVLPATYPTTLRYFYVYNNSISGVLTPLPSSFIDFRCYNNFISGSNLDLTNNSTLTTYQVYFNKISGAIKLPSPPNANLKNYNIGINYITGTIPDNISSFTQLKVFDCGDNRLSGIIPTLPSSIVDFNCGGQSGALQISGVIPQLSPYTLLEVFHCNQNQISGAIPNLSSNTRLTDFLCHGNYITGYVPPLSTLVNLDRFNCGNNLLSGTIPDLSLNTKLTTFRGYINSFTGYAGTAVPKLLTNFALNSNSLPQSEVDKILIAVKNAQSTVPRNTGILELGGGGNAAPSAAGIAAKNILTGYFWTVNTN